MKTKRLLLSFEKIHVWKLCVLLFVIGAATYATSLLNGFVWDDFGFFLQNVFAGSLKYLPQIFVSNTTAGAGISSNYYRPLTTISFAVDHFLWHGWNAFGMHLTNLFIHCANGLLLFLLLVQLRIKKSFALFIAAIFLAHPIQTEAVTYLSSRGDILYALFLFASLYLYTYSLYEDQLIIHIKKVRIVLSYEVMLLLAVLLFPLSILSKEGALTTGPMYAGVLFYIYVQQKLSLKKMWHVYRDHILVLFPLLFITLFYFYLRLTFLNFGNTLNYADSQGLYASHIFVRMFTFLKVFLLDIGLLAYPYPLYLERNTTIVTSFFSPWVIGGLITIGAMIGLGIWELKKKHSALIFFSLILVFSNLLSVSGIIPMTGLIHENWLYVPMIGLYVIVLVAAGLVFPKIVTYKKILFFGSIALIIVYAGLTIRQNTYWRDNISYLRHNLDYVNTARLHLNLGNAYLGIGKYDDAMHELKESEKIEDYPQAHFNIAVIDLRKGKKDAAEEELITALRMDPTYLYVYAPLVNIYIEKKEYDKALPYIEKLTLIYPKDYRILLLYAKVLFQSGNVQGSLSAYNKAVVLSHNDPKVVEFKKQLQ